MSVHNISKNTNLIWYNIVNGKRTPTLHNFYPDAAVGYKVNIEVNTPIFLPIGVKGTYNILNVWLTDQDYKEIHNNN